MNWVVFTSGRYTEHRLVKGRKTLITLIPTAFKGVACWGIRWDDNMGDDDDVQGSADLAEAKVQAEEIVKTFKK